MVESQKKRKGGTMPDINFTQIGAGMASALPPEIFTLAKTVLLLVAIYLLVVIAKNIYQIININRVKRIANNVEQINDKISSMILQNGIG